MGDTTDISWCDRTWSPWIGCTKISPACDGCYAAHLMDTRLGRVEWGPHGERKRTSESYWRQLAKWNREAEALGRRITVFPSLCDPFDNRADPGLRRAWFNEIQAYPNLLWLLLTKRPQNIVWMVRDLGFIPDNVALGTTCEDRKRVETNLSALREAEDELRPGGRSTFTFASFEPLLEDVGDLTRWLYGPVPLDWVITGGETDQGSHKARPSHPDWFRSIRDQCAAAGVPYHHKQNGEWSTTHPDWPRAHPTVMANDGTLYRPEDLAYSDGARYGEAVRAGHDRAHLTNIYRVGKRAAGRVLDGVEHNGMLELRHAG